MLIWDLGRMLSKQREGELDAEEKGGKGRKSSGEASWFSDRVKERWESCESDVEGLILLRLLCATETDQSYSCIAAVSILG